jgi:hypothetical protein
MAANAIMFRGIAAAAIQPPASEILVFLRKNKVFVFLNGI